MKKTLLTAILFTLIAFTAAAQNNNGNQRQRRQRMDPTEMHTRQAERLIKEMKLDKEKEDLFKVLYLDYQTARQNALDPKGENKEEEAIDYKALTDEKAKELIEKQLATQEAQNKIDLASLISSLLHKPHRSSSKDRCVPTDKASKVKEVDLEDLAEDSVDKAADLAVLVDLVAEASNNQAFIF